jgi:hypothetical protein
MLFFDPQHQRIRRGLNPERKSDMKRFAEITLIAVGLGCLAALAISVLPAEVRAADGPNALTLDVACDCRMGSPAFFGGNRGDAWIVSGKIFPSGTLPSGGNDPTQPVRGVAPIGEWTCRGQNALPFPPDLAAAYGASPFGFNTQYFVLNDGRALTVEGYALPNFTGERLSVTGGIGGFSGAGGQLEEGPIGTNVTGCLNFRATFKFQPGSIRGGGN